MPVTPHGHRAPLAPLPDPLVTVLPGILPEGLCPDPAAQGRAGPDARYLVT